MPYVSVQTPINGLAFRGRLRTCWNDTIITPMIGRYAESHPTVRARDIVDIFFL
jgi:hypothetical protein